MNDTALQCARVDAMPDKRTRDPNLPLVQEGSTRAACCICRAQVWISKPGQEAVRKGEKQPVCDACHPAAAVDVMYP